MGSNVDEHNLLPFGGSVKGRCPLPYGNRVGVIAGNKPRGTTMSQPAASSATTAPARRHNLSRLLTLVHREGALSRAALTRRTGLNRSTIAGLGRPSPLVTADESVVALTVNPDIDAVTVGLVGLGGVVHKRIRYPVASAPTATEAVNLVAALVAGMRSELDTRFRVLGIGVAVPGLVERSTGMVTLAPHLGW